MNKQFDEPMEQAAQPRAPRKKFAVAVALAGLLSLPVAADPPAQTSTIFDAAGDAVFPNDLFGAPVPPYLDMIKTSISYSRGIFHFEVQMNARIPDNPSPNFATAVNHMGPQFGIQTDRNKAGSFNFLGQTDTYRFNFIVGALYSFGNSGAGVPQGWSAIFIDVSSFMPVIIPLQIKGDTLIFEINSAWLGNPDSFQWAVGCECDPVAIPDEQHKVVQMVDYSPDHGYAQWPSP